jgi:hypothetical protein
LRGEEEGGTKNRTFISSQASAIEPSSTVGEIDPQARSPFSDFLLAALPISTKCAILMAHFLIQKVLRMLRFAILPTTKNHFECNVTEFHWHSPQFEPRRTTKDVLCDASMLLGILKHLAELEN